MCDSCTEDKRNWHKRTMQLAHHMAGLGLTATTRYTGTTRSFGTPPSIVVW